MKTLHFLVPTVRESFHFFRKLYDWVVGTAFQLAIASFCEEVSAVIFPPIIFGHWAKVLRDFVKNLSTGWSKLHSSCPEELFELNKFCKSCGVLFITFGLSDKKKLAFWQKKFARVVKRPFYIIMGLIQGEGFLWNFFCHFRKLIGKFPILSKNFRQVCQNWFLLVTRIMMRRK